jgi:hypothetical protein
MGLNNLKINYNNYNLKVNTQYALINNFRRVFLTHFYIFDNTYFTRAFKCN